MTLKKDDLQSIPLWVHFHGVPLEFWTGPGLSYIASSVGTPLYADHLTETGKRLSYAKICVEVNLESEFRDSVEVLYANGDCATVAIWYPWKPLRCMHRRLFGHSDEHCSSQSKPVPLAKPIVTVVETLGSEISVGEGLISGMPHVAEILPQLVSAGVDDLSAIDVCDFAAIDRVIATFDSSLPSVEDMADVGVVAPGLVVEDGGPLLGTNKFSPLNDESSGPSIAAPTNVVRSPLAAIIVPSSSPMQHGSGNVSLVHKKGASPIVPAAKHGKAKGGGKGGGGKKKK